MSFNVKKNPTFCP